MSSRPVRKIRPTAKLTSENAGELLLTSPRRAIVFAAGLAASSAPSSLVSEPPGSNAPTDFDVASSPDPPHCTSIKRSYALANIPVVNNNANTTDVQEDTGAHKSKKSKTTPTPGQFAAQPQYHTPIIEIDDINDPQAERLNKMDATADIKEFFAPMPRVSSQDKARMLCKLCESVVVYFIVSFLSCGFPQARDRVPQAGESPDL